MRTDSGKHLLILFSSCLSICDFIWNIFDKNLMDIYDTKIECLFIGTER